MNSRTSEAIDRGYDRIDDRDSGARDGQFGGEFILLAEVEDLIHEGTWLTAQELAIEQPVFCMRRAAEREARDVVGRAFARHARAIALATRY